MPGDNFDLGIALRRAKNLLNGTKHNLHPVVDLTGRWNKIVLGIIL